MSKVVTDGEVHDVAAFSASGDECPVISLQSPDRDATVRRPCRRRRIGHTGEIWTNVMGSGAVAVDDEQLRTRSLGDHRARKQNSSAIRRPPRLVPELGQAA